jgi:ABC-type transport system involved in multi-copper enzyme maturation permease subunit
MSSRAITERKEGKRGLKRWKTPVETAPSVMGEDQPIWARLVGGAGVALVVFAAVSFIALQYRKVLVLPGLDWEIGYGWAGFLGVVGLTGMLLHAASDAEMQIRRSYMAFGYVWLIVGIGVSVLPINGPAGAGFLPKGIPCLFLGLLFLMAYVRNETEEIYRDVAVYVMGGVGAAAAVGGFFFGSIYESFLLPYGAVLLIFGMLYLSAFVGLMDDRYDLRYWTGVGAGAGGVIFFLIAFVRSAVLPFMVSKEWINPSNGPDYLMPSGLVMMAAGVMYMMLGLAASSDNRLVVMTRRELATYFQTPIAYIVLFGFMVIACAIFVQFVQGALLEPDRERHLVPRRVPEPVIINYFIGWFPVLSLLFVVPILTMRLLSEERRAGTLEMLLSAPVDEIHVVLSKFAAGLIMFMLVWLPFWLYLLALWIGGGKPFDYRPLVGFLVAQLFSGAAFVSMGLFFSSLTRSQITAAILTFAGMLALTAPYFVIPLFIDLDEAHQNLLSYISYIELWINAFRGKLELRVLVFQSSLAVFWLFLTYKWLEARKWW